MFSLPNYYRLKEIFAPLWRIFFNHLLWILGYGSIYFEGDVNLTNLNLNDIVHIRRKEVIVYVDDNQKPPVGEGLNRYEFIYIQKLEFFPENTVFL